MHAPVLSNLNRKLQKSYEGFVVLQNLRFSVGCPHHTVHRYFFKGYNYHRLEQTTER